MAGPYTSPSLSGYCATEPSDDGANTSNNEVKWATHKTQIGDPLKHYIQSVDSTASTAFGKLLLNAIEAESANYTVVTSDYGKLISCTNTITVTLLAAGTAGSGFPLVIRNNGSGVITIDGNASETINGATTVTLNPGDTLIMASDGSNWEGVIAPSVEGAVTLQSTLDVTGATTLAALSATTSAFSGAVSSTKSAASGYSRVSPNECRVDNAGSFTGIGSGPTVVSAPDASALWVDVELRAEAGTANTVGLRSSTVDAYSDSGLTLKQGSCLQESYEFSALSAGTVIGSNDTVVRVLLSSAGASFRLNCTFDGGGFSGAYYRILGYGD